jgi:hypothetical protein
VVVAIVIVIVLGLAAPAGAGAEPATTIDLITMGAGDALFSRFGHAAICVTDARAPSGRCYNYGTADFRTPVPLTWDFLRGRALFWVAVDRLPRMLAAYAAEDRSVWRQRLRVSPEVARAIAEALEASTDERVRYYRYHHFRDNCTTRIRDVVDAATGGRLGDGAHAHDGETFRAYARAGFAGDLPLLLVTELFLGRAADERTSPWQAMFLPDVLRAEVARRFDAPPVELVRRRAPPPANGARWLGRAALVVLGVGLALIVLAGGRVRDEVDGRAMRARLALVPTALVLGLLGVVFWAMFVISKLPELRVNENDLVFVPFDLALPLLPRRWLRALLTARLVGFAAVLALHAVGLFVQPVEPALAALVPLAVARLYAWPRSRVPMR